MNGPESIYILYLALAIIVLALVLVALPTLFYGVKPSARSRKAIA